MVKATGLYPAGSTSRMRADALAVLAVLKVATAEQIMRLTRPHLTDNKTVRNALGDLAHHGLVLAVGNTAGPQGRIGAQPQASSQAKAQRLWALTGPGLEAAGTELSTGTPLGGTARGAGRAGAKHAMVVNETVVAFTTGGTGGTGGTDGSAGVGEVWSWATEVGHPIAAGERNTVRADGVLQAPEAGLPVLLVEVDRRTETPETIAAKPERYQRFFRRTTKDTDGRQLPYWRTLYQPTGCEGHPPVALVFTGAGELSMLNRITRVRELSRPTWSGLRSWCTGEDDWTDYRDAVPVLATTLDRLQHHGPTGAVWWRYGHQHWETLDQALDNPDDHRRRDERLQAEERENQRAERRQHEAWFQAAAAAPCPTCGTHPASQDEAFGLEAEAAGDQPRPAGHVFEYHPDDEPAPAIPAGRVPPPAARRTLGQVNPLHADGSPLQQRRDGLDQAADRGAPHLTGGGHLRGEILVRGQRFVLVLVAERPGRQRVRPLVAPVPQLADRLGRGEPARRAHPRHQPGGQPHRDLLRVAAVPRPGPPPRDQRLRQQRRPVVVPVPRPQLGPHLEHHHRVQAVQQLPVGAQLGSVRVPGRAPLHRLLEDAAR
ncbi:replication-relaxation family protein [Streptacidiphilus sp. EB129]|uniref:replication-relaxation family protein n=1 Tax=Streptacidiphilus sp. EB129 TaxID=3156262 RepID=UPI00351291FE